jgi:hypothetical protein
VLATETVTVLGLRECATPRMGPSYRGFLEMGGGDFPFCGKRRRMALMATRQQPAGVRANTIFVVDPRSLVGWVGQVSGDSRGAIPLTPGLVVSGCV